MIPKIIHYAWFGSEVPIEVKQRVASWHQILPDWEIKFWNADNWDVNLYDFSKEMAQKGAWAYVVDPLRFDVLYRYGGVYLDVDTVIHQNLDKFLTEKVVLGFLYNNSAGSSPIFSEPGNPFVEKVLQVYRDDTLHDLHEKLYLMTNNPVITMILKEQYPNFKLNDSMQELASGVKIFPKGWFAYRYPNDQADVNYTEHLFMNSWGTANLGLRGLVKRMVKRFAPTLWINISTARGAEESERLGLTIDVTEEIE